MNTSAALFRLLSDPTRLRILRLLANDRFNVSELTRLLAAAQSGVSRHLGFLRDAGLVEETREGGYVYYRTNRDASANGAALWALLEAEFTRAATDRVMREDDVRLQDLLRERRESFDTHVDPRLLVPGRSWAAWARALGHLLPPLDVADIGCGDGYLAVEMAAWARSVVAIDRSDDVLERARAMAGRRRVSNIEWKKGDLARLPLREQTIDLALLSQSLRHASEPERAVADAVRVLRPEGRLLILELRAHQQAWVRARFGDRRLGFADEELSALLENAGLGQVRVTVGSGRTGDPFHVLVASGRKPADRHRHARTEPRRPALT
jgi:DNA-binding transcriptional ArsR family regulator